MFAIDARTILKMTAVVPRKQSLIVREPRRLLRVGNGPSIKSAGASFSIALCAGYCQIRRRYCCIIRRCKSLYNYAVGLNTQRHEGQLRAGAFMCYGFATASGGCRAGQALRLTFHPLNCGR